MSATTDAEWAASGMAMELAVYRASTATDRQAALKLVLAYTFLPPGRGGPKEGLEEGSAILRRMV